MALAVAAFIVVPRLAGALHRLFKNGTLERSVVQVAETVLETLSHSGQIKTALSDLTVTMSKKGIGVPSGNGKVFCGIEGASASEIRHFLTAMQQILGPVGNPRFLLKRRSYLLGKQQLDYHPVPALLERRRAHAEHFAKRWNRHVGSAVLVDTQSVEGRRILLKARLESFAASFQKSTDRLSVWE